MKMITVSTQVYAAIWARYREGLETEDAILRDILQLTKSTTKDFQQQAVGFSDERNGVNFPEGFVIFRTYKGKEIKARATCGRWLLESTKATYSSLHKLSTAVVSGNENSWQNWKYKLPNGHEAFIDKLRASDAGETS